MHILVHMYLYVNGDVNRGLNAHLDRLGLGLRGTIVFSKTCFFLFFYGEKNGAGSGFQFELWAPNSLVYLGALRSALALWPWKQV